MSYQSDSKSDLRAWLFQLLAQLEQSQGVDAEKTELSDGSIILNITFIK